MKEKFKTNETQDIRELPNAIKQKLIGQKIECRIISNKEVQIGKYATVVVKNIPNQQRLMMSMEIVSSNYFAYVSQPTIPIPKFGKLICDILKFSITDVNHRNIPTTMDKLTVQYKIKCDNLDDHCYPLVYSNINGWFVPNNYELVCDGVIINENEWFIATIVKESTHEILPIQSHGGIFYSKLNKIFSLRIPKGNFKTDQLCKYQIIQLSKENVDKIYGDVYAKQLSVLENYSEMVLLQMMHEKTRCLMESDKLLRRSITVKLPLPNWVIECLKENGIDGTKTVTVDQNQQKLGCNLVQNIGGKWTIVESGMQLSESSITFETRSLGCIMFVKCKSNQERHLLTSLTLLEKLILSERQTIMSFLYFKSNQIYLWTELVGLDSIEKKKSTMEDEGFIFIPQEIVLEKNEETKATNRRSKIKNDDESFRRKTFEIGENVEIKINLTGDLERKDLHEKKLKKLNEKSIKFSEKEEAERNEESNFDSIDCIGKMNQSKADNDEDEEVPIEIPDIVFRSGIETSNSFVIKLVPTLRDGEKSWEKEIIQKLDRKNTQGLIRTNETIYVPQSSNTKYDIDETLMCPHPTDLVKFECSEEQKRLHFTFQIDYITIPNRDNLSYSIELPHCIAKVFLGPEVMKNYFSILTQTEIEEIQREKELKETKEEMILEEKSIEKTKIINTNYPVKTFSYNRLVGLSRPRVMNRRIVREPKVISRRSLNAMCEVIKQGLTLGVYLTLPDNVIAGIGFDSLSQLSFNPHNNVTYKIILAWKKMISYNKMPEHQYMEQFVSAIATIGYTKLSQLISYCWKNNMELTHDDCQRIIYDKDYELPPLK